jgi:hypothetical protein
LIVEAIDFPYLLHLPYDAAALTALPRALVDAARPLFWQARA